MPGTWTKNGEKGREEAKMEYGTITWTNVDEETVLSDFAEMIDADIKLTQEELKASLAGNIEINKGAAVITDGLSLQRFGEEVRRYIDERPKKCFVFVRILNAEGFEQTRDLAAAAGDSPNADTVLFASGKNEASKEKTVDVYCVNYYIDASYEYATTFGKSMSQCSLYRDREQAYYVAYLLKEKNLSVLEAADKLKEKYENRAVCEKTIYLSIKAGLVPGVTEESRRHFSTRLDPSGKVYLPAWIKSEYGYTVNDQLEIEADEERIVLWKK